MTATQVYVTADTKRLIEAVSKADSRGQNDEIRHLFLQRAKELGIHDVKPSSGDSGKNTKANQ